MGKCNCGQHNEVLLERLLPGLNCGSCGYQFCREFAEQLLHGVNEPEDCPVLALPRFTKQMLELRRHLPVIRDNPY